VNRRIQAASATRFLIKIEERLFTENSHACFILNRWVHDKTTKFWNLFTTADDESVHQ